MFPAQQYVTTTIKQMSHGMIWRTAEECPAHSTGGADPVIPMLPEDAVKDKGCSAVTARMCHCISTFYDDALTRLYIHV